MPGLGRKAFAAGDVLTAADLQGYAVDQSIMVFGGTAARGSAISSPSEGMFTYLSDSNTLQYYNGTAWVDSYSATNGAAVTNRNLLYNGAMQVAQRGTSVTGNTAGGYLTADRWVVGLSALGTWTQTIENDAPSGSGLRKSLKMLCTTSNASPAGGSFLQLTQALEGQDVQRIAKGTASAQQLTLSFWVKSNVTGTYIAELFDNDNTRQLSATYSISASATWEKKTITFPADTTGAFDNDNAASLYVNWWLATGSTYSSGTLNTAWASSSSANRAVGQTNLAAATNNYWQVTGVQLEVGPVATSFEFKSYGQELRECQRYYQRGISVAGSGNTTTTVVGVWTLQTPMRATPTLSQSANLNLADGVNDRSTSSPSVTGLDGNNHMYVALINNFTSLTANRPYIGPRFPSTDGQFVFSAEL